MDKTKYWYLGAINTVIGFKKNDRFSLKMICSEFVDSLLKLANDSILPNKRY